MSTIENHWAVCDKSGAVFYDEEGRAYIYATREAARNYSKQHPEDNLHPEKVEIQ